MTYRENPTLKGVLPSNYARPSLDEFRLAGLVDIISNIGFNESSAKSKDVFGRVIESRVLAALPGTLLTKLLSGELRVPGAKLKEDYVSC